MFSVNKNATNELTDRILHLGKSLVTPTETYISCIDINNNGGEVESKKL